MIKFLLLLIAFNVFAQSTKIKDNVLRLGKKDSQDIYIYADTGAANAPFIQYDFSEGKWIQSEDGTTTKSFGTQLTAKGNLIGFGTETEECVLDKTDGRLLTVDSTATCGFDFKDAPVSVTVQNKAELQSHDGANPASVPAPASDGLFLISDSAEQTGLRYSDQLQGKLNPITDWQSYTPTFQGLGSVTISHAIYRQVGDTLEINLKGIAGTPSATELRVSLPNGLTVSSSYSGNADVGRFQRGIDADNRTFPALVTANNTFINIGSRNEANNSAFTPLNGTSFVNAGNTFSLIANLKVNELSSGLDAVVRPGRDLIRVSAYQASALGSGSNTNPTVTFSSEFEDNYNAFNGTVFTSPEEACYSVSATVRYQPGTASDMFAILKVNGSASILDKATLGNRNFSSDFFASIISVDTLCLTAGETIEVGAFASPSRSLEGGLSFSISENVTENVIAGVFEQIESDTLDQLTQSSAGIQTLAANTQEQVSIGNATNELQSGTVSMSGNDVLIGKTSTYWVSGSVGLTSGASTERIACQIRLDRGGSISTISEDLAASNNDGTSSAACPAKLVPLQSGDRLELWVRNDSGISRVVSTSSHLTFISVGEQPNTEDIVKNLNDNNNIECQTKSLAADQTTDTPSIIDLQMNNMVVGKKYSANLEARFQVGANDATASVVVLHNGVTVAQAQGGNGSGSNISFGASAVNQCFVATTTSTQVATSSLGAGSFMRAGSRFQLCELPDNYICSSNKFD